MKTGDIVFLRRPYKGYRAVELMERLECRWLVRICLLYTSSLSLSIISVNTTFLNLLLSSGKYFSKNLDWYSVMCS